MKFIDSIIDRFFFLQTLIKKSGTISIILILLIITGCKKYPEGGHLFSLSKTEGRILGSYYIQELTVNSLDTSLVGSSYMCTEADISFTSDGFEGSKTLNTLCGTFPTNSWYVTGNKRELIISFIYTPSAGDLYPIAINQNISVTWTIQRLTKNDLWLKTILNQREYHLKLKYFR
jgi:hypothetical protein